MELTILFFYEIPNGKSLEELSDLKNQINSTMVEIHHLETELNINKDNNDLKQ